MSGRKVSVVLSHLDSLHVSLMLQHSASPLCSGRSSLQLLYVSGLQRWHLVFHLCDTSLPCFFQVSVYWSGSHPSFPIFIPKTACYRRLHRPKKNCIGKSANFIACMFCQSEAGIMSNTTVIEATGSGVNDRIVAVKRWDWQRRSS